MSKIKKGQSKKAYIRELEETAVYHYREVKRLRSQRDALLSLVKESDPRVTR